MQAPLHDGNLTCPRPASLSLPPPTFPRRRSHSARCRARRRRLATARSTDGQPIEVWSTLLSNIWAQVMPRTGDEVYRDRYRWEVEEVDFSIRWTSVAIEPEYRVRYDSSDYDIKAVINVAEADREIKLITTRHK